MDTENIKVFYKIYLKITANNELARTKAVKLYLSLNP